MRPPIQRCFNFGFRNCSAILKQTQVLVWGIGCDLPEFFTRFLPNFTFLISTRMRKGIGLRRRQQCSGSLKDGQDHSSVPSEPTGWRSMWASPSPQSSKRPWSHRKPRRQLACSPFFSRCSQQIYRLKSFAAQRAQREKLIVGELPLQSLGGESLLQLLTH